MRIFQNPYRNDITTWRKGNLHAHTTNSDGWRSPQGLVDAYADRGYDFLMISDHDAVTNVSELDTRGMALIPGNEVTGMGPHILHVGAHTRVPPDRDRQKVIDTIDEDGGFAIVNHPNWERSFDHCPQDRLETWSRYTGIEIYNAVVRRQYGHPQATDRWDRLLSAGRVVWGFANDDAHTPDDEGIAWNMVQCESLDRDELVEAMRHGHFYASTGVEISRIHGKDSIIEVVTTNAQRIIVFSDHGHREATVDSDSIRFPLPEHGTISYVRFECWGPGESMAWTQPFLLR